MNKKSNASKCVFLIKQNILVFTNTLQKDGKEIIQIFIYLFIINPQ